MSGAHKQPLTEPTALDALALHMVKHYSGGDAPAIVLRRGAMQFAELRKVPA